jgi:geranylgeranyl diphosphate synthase type II
MRVGALIAGVQRSDLNAFLPLGFRIGAAFQIQDDVLNLDAEERLYGKEIGGDIAEGKRTLIAIHALQAAAGRTRDRLAAIYAKPREAKTAEEIAWVLATMRRRGSIGFARDISLRLTLSAKKLFERRFDWLPRSPHRAFLEEMFQYMIERKL